MSEEPEASGDGGWSEDDLLAELRELSALIGPSHCVNTQQLVMRPEFFPDPWKSDLRSMRRLLQRLMCHAGLPDEDLKVELQDERGGVEELGTHLATNLYFGGWVDGRAQFAISTLGDPRATIGPACIEVGRAVLHKRRMEARPTNYRSDAAADPDVDLPDRHEGFVAASLLGWGLLVTNASFDPRSVGRNVGYDAENARIESTVEVELELAVWVLAVLWRARPDSFAWSDELRAELNPSQKQAFDREFAELEGQGEELLGELGWDAKLAGKGPTYQPLRVIEADALDDGLDARARETALALRQPNRAMPVFRVRRRRTLGLSLAGMLLGSMSSAATMNLLLFPLLLGAGTILGYLWRTSYCADPSCHKHIPPSAETCEGCGGFVAGEIDNDNKRLDALEAFEEKQRAALAESGPPLSGA